MSKPSGVVDQIFGELALKIEAELPEEIVRFVTFRPDEEGKNLVVDWSVELAPEDLKLLTDVVTGYCGSFVNLKESNGKDRGCFSVPRNQPPPAIPSPVQTKEARKSSLIKPQENQASLAQPMKQQSPLTIFQGNYCGSCADQATCTPRTAAGWERLAIC